MFDLRLIKLEYRGGQVDYDSTFLQSSIFDVFVSLLKPNIRLTNKLCFGAISLY